MIYSNPDFVFHTNLLKGGCDWGCPLSFETFSTIEAFSIMKHLKQQSVFVESKTMRLPQYLDCAVVHSLCSPFFYSLI
jgi:hypothetical protein